jgi:L-fuconolactonase
MSVGDESGPSLIDAHLHLWDPSANVYPWLADEPALHRPFLLSDLAPADRRTDGFIVVEAGCHDGSAELDWLDRYAAQWPGVLGVVAQVPLELGSSAAALLAATAGHPLTVGLHASSPDAGGHRATRIAQPALRRLRSPASAPRTC